MDRDRRRARNQDRDCNIKIGWKGGAAMVDRRDLDLPIDGMYKIARDINHEFGIPWYDPRTGRRYDPPASTRIRAEADAPPPLEHARAATEALYKFFDSDTLRVWRRAFEIDRAREHDDATSVEYIDGRMRLIEKILTERGEEY